MKKVVFLTIVLVGLLFLAGCGNNNKNNSNSGDDADTSVSDTTSNSSTSAEAAYFDENSPVLFFYSDNCGWCTKEKTELEALAPEGYRVKPMDVGKNPNYWEKYSISGTPTFIANNGEGEKSSGYMVKDELKKWLDKNGAKIK